MPRTVRRALDARSFGALLDRSVRLTVLCTGCPPAGRFLGPAPPPGVREPAGCDRFDAHPSGRMTSLRFVIDRLVVDTARVIRRPNV